LCCLSTSNTKGKRIFIYRLSPETFGYTLVQGLSVTWRMDTNLRVIQLFVTSCVHRLMQLTSKANILTL